MWKLEVSRSVMKLVGKWVVSSGKMGFAFLLMSSAFPGLSTTEGVVLIPIEEGLAVGSPIPQRAEAETGFSSPRWAPVPGRNSTSGSINVSRPSRARDRVTLVEVSPAPGRVTAGVGSVSRGAETELDSLGSLLRPTLQAESASMTSILQFHQSRVPN